MKFVKYQKIDIEIVIAVFLFLNTNILGVKKLLYFFTLIHSKINVRSSKMTMCQNHVSFNTLCIGH